MKLKPSSFFFSFLLRPPEPHQWHPRTSRTPFYERLLGTHRENKHRCVLRGVCETFAAQCISPKGSLLCGEKKKASVQCVRVSISAVFLRGRERQQEWFSSRCHQVDYCCSNSVDWHPPPPSNGRYLNLHPEHFISKAKCLRCLGHVLLQALQKWHLREKKKKKRKKMPPSVWI